VYRFVPDEIDRKRSHHQAVKQEAEDLDIKRIGNLGELAFEQFCREYLPVEMWDWENEDALRYCNPESFSGHDFEVFGYEADIKTSRDVSSFLPQSILETDPDDDIVVMVWHRDAEDSLILLGWERLETLKSKVASQEEFGGNEPEKLDHLAARPMNELMDLGPNTAHMNQKPTNPFEPGDRVVRADDSDASVAVVVDVLPPEKSTGAFGQEMDGEAVDVAFPSTLDDGPGKWRDIHPALLSSYCDDQDIKLYTYKHTNLDFAANPFVPGDRVLKMSHDDPDTAVVVERQSDETLAVGFDDRLQDGDRFAPELSEFCESENISLYNYSSDEIRFVEP
jgi:hypothetical protein